MQNNLGLKYLLDNGLLFEINRVILHPFGLSLAFCYDGDESNEPVDVVLIKDEDDFGTTYDEQTLKEGSDKLNKFMEEIGYEKYKTRMRKLGYIFQNLEE